MARPSKYTDKLGNEIAALIASDITLEKIAKAKGLSKDTLIKWLANPDFYIKCAGAREIQADVIDNKIAKIIDDVETGKLSTDQGRVILSGLQWRAAKKAPKKYGDKINLDVKQENPLEKASYDEITSLLGWVKQERETRPTREDAKGKA